MTAQVGQVGDAVVIPGGGAAEPQSTRMSALAVTATIVGILACLTCFAGYVFGVVGNILAISALILIRREQGRLRGRSLAIAAVALNSLAFLFGVVFTAGAAQMAKTVTRYVTPLEEIQHKQLDKAKEAFAKSVSAEVTTERLSAFDAKVKDQLGNYTSSPTKDLFEFTKRALDAIRDQSAALSKLPADKQDVLFALPTDFEKGRALLIVCLDSSDKTPQFALGRIRNLGVLKDGSGEVIWLLPLKDNTPAGLALPKAEQGEGMAGRSAETVPPPAVAPEEESRHALPPS